MSSIRTPDDENFWKLHLGCTCTKHSSPTHAQLESRGELKNYLVAAHDLVRLNEPSKEPISFERCEGLFVLQQLVK